MSINSTLRKEGIQVIEQLNTLEINKIASNISEKICTAFPEHNIHQSDLFISIARLNMYIADMPNDMAIAKYFYKNNSIYFSKNMNLEDLNTVAIHECLHFMQELKNKHGKLLRLGLYNLETPVHTGMAINEAAVQLMASQATHTSLDTVKYYNMELTTESPDYYPLQTALLKQMTYFTGTYPLFHSTLFSNDIFKNTFIEKSSVKTYQTIEYNLDLLVHYESELSKATCQLSQCSDETTNFNKIKKINAKIDALKAIILEKTLETQNTILLDCFYKEFDSIHTLEDVKNFQSHLYNFKHVLIHTKDYHFFNDFYCDIMNKLEDKREYILQHDTLDIDTLTKDISVIQSETYGYQFFKRLFHKLKLLLEEKLRIKDI